MYQGALMGITWMCIFQVVVIGYTTFKRFSGLYFWSIFVATVAMTVWTLGVVMYHFVLGNTHVWIPTVLITAGYLIFLPAKFLFILSRYRCSRLVMNSSNILCLVYISYNPIQEWLVLLNRYSF
jgi:hypothetical protein